MAAENAPSSSPDKSGSSLFWSRLRWLAVRGAALAGAFVVLLIVVVGAAGWYTSRSEFCRSCHIMEPYYQSWAKSTHKDVPCIECHFPPGIGGKLRGKMLGLIQLAKYVTASAGPRPSAEIPDASCLRSGCHETRLLRGKVDYHGIPFDHAPHLGELRRGKQLRCTSCHSQIVQGKHMTVTASTCFLCHFKDGEFNQGLGACTRCHEIPTGKFDLGGGVTFTHELAYKKGVDCEACHRDLVRGNGEVSPDRCVSCHNREDDLQKLTDHEFMHRMHVSEHKIDCLQCHARIEHTLDRNKIVHSAKDCAACHPNHHSEQVAMLQGTGGLTLATHTTNVMVNTRADCHTCHRSRTVSASGAVLWKASTDTCAMCHDASKIEQLDVYQTQLQDSLPKIRQALTEARKALPGAGLKEERQAEVGKQLDALLHDVEFLAAARGVHNIHYASKLQQEVLDTTAKLCGELKVPPPEVKLPKVDKPIQP